MISSTPFDFTTRFPRTDNVLCKDFINNQKQKQNTKKENITKKTHNNSNNNNKNADFSPNICTPFSVTFGNVTVFTALNKNKQTNKQTNNNNNNNNNNNKKKRNLSSFLTLTVIQGHKVRYSEAHWEPVNSKVDQGIQTQLAVICGHVSLMNRMRPLHLDPIGFTAGGGVITVSLT